MTVLCGPGSPYLLSIDRRFDQRAGLHDSSFLMGCWGAGSQFVSKRLGDSLYENWLVRQQIQARFGKPYLPGQQDQLEQYRHLMQAGIRFARRHGLVLGAPLSVAQQALLVEDVVWLVSVTVAGESVLAPVVYKAGRQVRQLGWHVSPTTKNAWINRFNLAR